MGEHQARNDFGFDGSLQPLLIAGWRSLSVGLISR
jgi:hypothetical protein